MRCAASATAAMNPNARSNEPKASSRYNLASRKLHAASGCRRLAISCCVSLEAVMVASKVFERGRGEVRVGQVVAPLDRVHVQLGHVIVLLVLHARLDDDGFAVDLAHAPAVERLGQLAGAII